MLDCVTQHYFKRKSYLQTNKNNKTLQTKKNLDVRYKTLHSRNNHCHKAFIWMPSITLLSRNNIFALWQIIIKRILLLTYMWRRLLSSGMKEVGLRSLLYTRTFQPSFESLPWVSILHPTPLLTQLLLQNNYILFYLFILFYWLEQKYHKI